MDDYDQIDDRAQHGPLPGEHRHCESAAGIRRRRILLMGVASLATLVLSCCASPTTAADDLWALARSNERIHRFSTLFTAHQVRDYLATDDGIESAIAWCKRTSVTKVYLESFRSGYDAPSPMLAHARDQFREAGFEVSGCVTTTIVGKRSTGWNLISCYTDRATQEKLQQIFQRTAALFDEIMIDDFWFTDCQCNACKEAREQQTVTVGEKTYPVASDSWEDYRCELLVQLSKHRILEPARRINRNVKIIIKFPQWYDRVQDRGYDVIRETRDFDRIWVGTETRDYNDSRWGGTPQYEAYFIMRWLGRIGGPKCGGGWFDPLGTTPSTYVEQARQTILAGARESFLFCFGALQKNTGPANVETLRANIPELFRIAKEVRNRSIVGIAAYKPASSSPGNESRVFDFVGMLGLPLVPCHQFPAHAKAAFFSVHALKDPDLAGKLNRLLAKDTPVLVTDGLAKRLKGTVDLDRDNVRILAVGGKPKSLLEMPQEKLDALRQPLLEPIEHRFQAPARVALYVFEDGSWVIENFNDRSVTVKLDGTSHKLEPRGWIYTWHAR